MPQRKKFPKPKLVVSNNVVDLAAVREERDLPTYIVDITDDRSECRDILEQATAEFDADPDITGGFITLITRTGRLINFAGGITLAEEAMFLSLVADERKAEWKIDYGGYGEEDDAE